MNVFGVVIAVTVGIAIAVGLFILAVSVIVWNVNDMLTVGVNFWNVFWTLLALTLTLGGTTKAATS